jgi:hypothetical protein
MGRQLGEGVEGGKRAHHPGAALGEGGVRGVGGVEVFTGDTLESHFLGIVGEVPGVVVGVTLDDLVVDILGGADEGDVGAADEDRAGEGHLAHGRFGRFVLFTQIIGMLDGCPNESTGRGLEDVSDRIGVVGGGRRTV